MISDNSSRIERRRLLDSTNFRTPYRVGVEDSRCGPADGLNRENIRLNYVGPESGRTGGDAVVFEVEAFVRTDDDPIAQTQFKFIQGVPFFIEKQFLNFRIYGQVESARGFHGLAFQVEKSLVDDGGLGQKHALALAVVAGLPEQASDVFPGAFTGHFDQAEFGHLEDLGLGLVPQQGFLEGGEDLFPVGFAFHVDEIDYDQPADIPQPELIRDLLDRFQVGLDNGFLQVVLSHVTAGVDVDGGQGLRGFDDNVPPDLSQTFLDRTRAISMSMP